MNFRRLCLVVSCQLALCSLCAGAVTETDISDRSHSRQSRPEYDEALDNGTYGYYPIRVYTTDDVTSPQTNFLRWDPACDDGLYTFITPRGWSLPNPGPMILDARGELVWAEHFDNQFGGQAYDFKVQQYQGQDYLTFWLGDDRVRGHGDGYYYMLNASYQTVHRVGAANGLAADLHEFLITPEGTALMTVYEIVRYNGSLPQEVADGHPDPSDPPYIWECLFQEVAIDSGDLIFEWRASEHIPLSLSYRLVEPGTSDTPIDWFHINSVQKDELGNYLISARYTHSIMYIDGKTGELLWTLGGKSNDFMDLSDGLALTFAWQHDARFHDVDTFPSLYQAPSASPNVTTKLLTLFDNAAQDSDYEYGMDHARGLLLELVYPTPGVFPSAPEHQAGRQHHPPESDYPDLNAAKIAEINGSMPGYSVRLIRSYDNPQQFRSSSQGSVQVLPQRGSDPKMLVGYGLNPVWTEFAANGTVLCNVHFGAETSWERGEIQSYRTYKFPWKGQPVTSPSIDISDDDAELLVSWNGATEVADWILQSSDSIDGDELAWEDVIRVEKQGFETVIPIPDDLTKKRLLRVIAIGPAGRRLPHGVSETIDHRSLAVYLPLLLDSSHLAASISDLGVLGIGLVTISLFASMFFLYEIYRRYLSSRKIRPSVRSVRWHKGFAYVRLGSETAQALRESLRRFSISTFGSSSSSSWSESGGSTSHSRSSSRHSEQFDLEPGGGGSGRGVREGLLGRGDLR